MYTKFRHSAGFGKRIEYYVIGLILKEGIDIYVPLVDDNAIDAVVRQQDGSYLEIQIKARSASVVDNNVAFFPVINHNTGRLNHEKYFYVFYSERLDKIWILSGEEFDKEARISKSGVTEGKRSLKLNGSKNGKPYPLPKFDKYNNSNFDRFRSERS